ncbi:hypothetical protein TKK_0014656 [Trichogramma kaykai]|uniref:Ubiquitin-like protease family profile domain-containing protein n=1 Tax=Trichogramma kaykai TaxID=54128 RepID=A0ABD2WE32_9HYME
MLDLITNNDFIEDIHIDFFHGLLSNCSPNFAMNDMWSHQFLEISEIPQNKRHIEILFKKPLFENGIGHWVCSYYDCDTISIYDSLNEKECCTDYKSVLQILHPYCFTSNPPKVKFPEVQQQPNGVDCGVFAIAFATSLIMGIKPNMVEYELEQMRPHLRSMFENNKLQNFPCTLKPVDAIHVKQLSYDDTIILTNGYLTDNHMDYFSALLKNVSMYSPVSTLLISNPDRILPNSSDRPFLQLMYKHPPENSTIGHWFCSYYDGISIYIYDSMKKNRNIESLDLDNKCMLQRLYKQYFDDGKQLIFPNVPRQSNGVDCCVFAIAFATTLLFGNKPREDITYDGSAMRSHLSHIFNTRIISEFPFSNNNVSANGYESIELIQAKFQLASITENAVHDGLKPLPVQRRRKASILSRTAKKAKLNASFYLKQKQSNSKEKLPFSELPMSIYSFENSKAPNCGARVDKRKGLNRSEPSKKVRFSDLDRNGYYDKLDERSMEVEGSDLELSSQDFEMATHTNR